MIAKAKGSWQEIWILISEEINTGIAWTAYKQRKVILKFCDCDYHVIT